MATVDSTQYSNANASPPNKLDPTEFGGELRSAYAKFNGTLADGDDINLFTLPDGARVQMVSYKNAAFGSSVAMDIGTSDDDDRFVAAESVAAAGQGLVPSLDPGTKIDGPTVIKAKLEGANPNDDVDLEVMVYYTVN
jgi:hypothetical protein